MFGCKSYHIEVFKNLQFDSLAFYIHLFLLPFFFPLSLICTSAKWLVLSTDNIRYTILEGTLSANMFETKNQAIDHLDDKGRDPYMADDTTPTNSLPPDN